MEQDMLKAMRARIKPLIALPTPRWLLELGALLLGTEIELVLKSRWVLPRRAQALGFRFTHPDLPRAVAHLLAPPISPPAPR